MHVILDILGEIWCKGRNLTSLILVEVFAEVAKVNIEALNTKSNPARQNVFSYSYLGILFAVAKNAEIRGLRRLLKSSPNGFF